MDYRHFCKSVLYCVSVFALFSIAGCSQNPLTGKQEFTGLMSEQQEQSIGAAEHQQIIKEYGGVYDHPGIQAYVNEIGQKLARQSDRPDVQYHFTVLDSPIVNAFALPGGYVYVTRGTLVLANSEAELAAVLGHEIGHVAARHQASRYSQGVLTQLGASVLSAAIGMPAASQAIGLGTNLYMSSYSRDQESEADILGVRYLDRTGYDRMAMSDFLRDMQLHQSTEAQVKGKQEKKADFFSSHPDTVGRVVTSRAEAQKYPPNAKPLENRDRYLSMVRGMLYGDNLSQGFVRDNAFYHPEIGFVLSIPQGFNVDNKPERLAVEGRDGTIFVLDMAGSKGASSAEDYVAQVWLKGRGQTIEPLEVNGMHAATTALQGSIKNQPVNVRLVAIEWGKNDFVRMQMLIPNGASQAAVDDMKRISYSFHQITSSERKLAKPYQVDLVKAGAGDTVQSLALRMGVSKMQVEQFAALNGLTPAQPLVAGRMYKVIR
jgi:predicted Zn-dependent protease